MVGVNEYRVDDDELTEIHRPDPGAERRQRERVADDPGRARRGRGRADARRRSARRRPTDANLMPALIACARARVTEGEMIEAMQSVFGHLHGDARLLRAHGEWTVAARGTSRPPWVPLGTPKRIPHAYRPGLGGVPLATSQRIGTPSTPIWAGSCSCPGRS